MRHAVVTRILLFAVMLAPVVRATCGVSCVHVPEPTPPPCHGAEPETPANDCSHDHDRVVARVASPSIEPHAAILPAINLSAAPPQRIAFHAPGEGRPVVPRASPQAILRV